MPADPAEGDGDVSLFGASRQMILAMPASRTAARPTVKDCPGKT
jgi:hypothetical protein